MWKNTRKKSSSVPFWSLTDTQGRVEEGKKSEKTHAGIRSCSSSVYWKIKIKRDAADDAEGKEKKTPSPLPNGFRQNMRCWLRATVQMCPLFLIYVQSVSLPVFFFFSKKVKNKTMKNILCSCCLLFMEIYQSVCFTNNCLSVILLVVQMNRFPPMERTRLMGLPPKRFWLFLTVATPTLKRRNWNISRVLLSFLFICGEKSLQTSSSAEQLTPNKNQQQQQQQPKN